MSKREDWFVDNILERLLWLPPILAFPIGIVAGIVFGLLCILFLPVKKWP